MVCIKAIAFVVVVVAVGLLAPVGESRAARKDLGINLGGLGIGIGLGRCGSRRGWFRLWFWIRLRLRFWF